MADATLEGKIADILALVLQRPVVPADAISRDHEPRWDSLKHIEIIFALEDALNVRFDEDDIAEIKNFDDIVRLAEAKRAA
ncbi:acyl carrier protein [Lichenifustis flavocetrariae]|uniref:Acyl carrier protein n=1 Tax=Lichenifustis flavocetrariae TaxID=2949735 RepID=A0AA41Z2X3_9HYPH|nr:acyl carrier protein [Lichenifustis flavocetrariae]MCW6509533.1 acyl carrier protein [Lichenifustis flavocetrariae]